MKSYFIQNVMNQMKYRKGESLIMISLTFVTSIFLSLIFFFGYNDSMEANIANSLELTYKMNSDHIFSSENNNKLFYLNENSYDYYERFTSWIEETGKKKNVERYEYHVVLTLENEYSDNDNFYGIDSTLFYENENLYVVNGRKLTQDELDNKSNKILVKENTSYLKDGSKVIVDVGDVLTFGIYDYDSNEIISKISCEVVGLYNVYDDSEFYVNQNNFIDYQGIIVSNGFIKDYIENNKEYISFSSVEIDNIAFKVADYKKFDEFKEELKVDIKDFDNELKELNYPVSQLSIMDNNDSEVIHASSRIKNIYKIIFMLIFMIITFVLVSCIFYLLRKKTREIAVYDSLGQPRIKIVLHYFLSYMLIAVIGTLFGLIVGYLISLVLTNNMAQDSVAIQTDLLRFSVASVMKEMGNQAHIPTFTFTFSSCIYIFIIMISIVCISVAGSVFIILKGNIISRNGGWNS